MAKGDHLYYSCGAYYHHGIDCGDGTVIEYSTQGVRQIPKYQFGQGKTIHKKYDSSSYSPDQIVARAKSRLGERDYNVVTNNCEHLANWATTNSYHSDQVDRGAKFAGTGVGTSVAAKVAANVATKNMGVVSKALVQTGLREAPKATQFVAQGLAKGGGGVVSAIVTDVLIDNILPNDPNASRAENNARANGRAWGKTAGLAAGVGTAVVGGGIAAIAIAPVAAGLAVAGLAYLFSQD